MSRTACDVTVITATNADMPFSSGHETRLEWIYRRGEPQRVRSYCDCGWTTPALDDVSIARRLAAEHLPDLPPQDQRPAVELMPATT